MKEVVHNHAIPGASGRPILVDFVLPETSPAGEPLQVILFIHGYKGYKDWGAWHLMEQYFVSRGFGFAKINVSHNGGTPEQPIDFPDLDAFGENTYSKEVYDVLQAIQFLEKSLQAVDHEINLMGHSRGGGVCVLTAEKSPDVDRLITLAAIDDIPSRFPKGEPFEQWKEKGVYYVKNGRTKQDMPHYFSFYEDWEQNKEALDIEAKARQLQKPTLVIHGEADEAVAVESAKNLNQWVRNSKLVVLEKAGHTFGAYQPYDTNELPKDLEKVCKTIQDWIRT